MKIYQSCGKINLEMKTVTVKTLLPELEEGTYKYVKYYNISNANFYGILGVLLVENGPNKDLSDMDKELNTISVDVNPIHLDELKPLSNGRDFADLKPTDTIHFMCFHDDRFTGSEKILAIFQESLPNFPDFDMIEEPKVGNGGVLTLQGCS